METPADLLQTLQALEIELLDPRVRKSDRVSRLLADEFVEYGSSGRIYTKADVLAALADEVPARLTAHGFSARLIAPDTALLCYVACRHAADDAQSLRSSIWQKREGHWHVLFHQGTPCAARK